MKHLSLLVLSLFLLLTVKGQDEKIQPSTYWFEGGVGVFYATNDISGFNGYLSANLLKNTNFYKFRYLILDEFNLFGPTPSEVYHSPGLMFGKGFTGKYYHLVFSGGVGFTAGVMRGRYLGATTGWFGDEEYEKDRFFTPSIPLEIELFLKPFRQAGLGLFLMGDLNLQRSYFGFGGKIGIGRLK